VKEVDDQQLGLSDLHEFDVCSCSHPFLIRAALSELGQRVVNHNRKIIN
jgi:hypothetical protein